ncbi:MAG TPA: helix-hairpin-helix domain-containing protein, partial [Oscillospiraceae bacterium]|nr:helix-hairpin-helix domain-containing protein [Oscillospiraceae bacterium]
AWQMAMTENQDEENGGFGSVEELMDVKGIGEDLFEKIKDKIFASPVTDKQTFSSADDFIKNENIGILDINKATAEEFDLLPGISPKTAVKIVNFREDIGGFSSIYELLYVDGVTESVFNKIKDYITV